MGTVVRAVKAVRILLMLVVLVVMLWTYAYLPETISLQQDNAVKDPGVFTCTKDQLFYTFLLAFASINAVLMLYFNMLSKNALPDVPILFSRRGRRSMPLVLWVGFMHIIVQLFLLSGWMHVSLSNIEGAIIYSGNALLIIGLVLLILGIVLLPLMFLLIRTDADT